MSNLLTTDFFFNTFCPITGIVLTSLQYSSTIKITLEARRLQSIGDINPTPVAITFVVCVLYVIYGVMLKNTYFVLSAYFGLPVCMFACLTTLQLLGLHNRRNAAALVERILIVAFTVISTIGLLYTSDVLSFALARNIIGRMLMVSVLTYYLAPLAGTLHMIRKQDASTLYYPTIIASLMATATWTVYGVSFGDPNLYVPSLGGFTLSLIQFGVKTFYNRKKYTYKEPAALEQVGPGAVSDAQSTGTLEHSQDIRSRRMSFDNGPVLSYNSLSTPPYQDNADYSDPYPVDKPITNVEYDKHSDVGSASASGVGSPSAMSALGVGNAEQPGESGRFITAISGLLAPFKPTLSVRIILATEEDTSAYQVPYRDEPVTFRGVFADIVTGIKRTHSETPPYINSTHNSNHNSDTGDYTGDYGENYSENYDHETATPGVELAGMARQARGKGGITPYNHGIAKKAHNAYWRSTPGDTEDDEADTLRLSCIS
jgi:uncharacterized protein with PQ loop repeat